MIESETKVYSEMVDEIFSRYEGKYESLLRNIPRFFNLLQRIYTSRELTWEAKFKINSCFSYFAIPDDYIPDDEGPEGFLDDFFVCVYVLDDLSTEYSILIKENWEFEDNIMELIPFVLDETIDLLGEKCYDILGFTGLLRFDEISSISHLFQTPQNINEKIERIDYENQELLSLLRTILVYSGNKNILRTLSSLKKTFDEDEWRKVQNIIERSEFHESKYDNSHEIELDKIRRKIVLGINEDILDD
ncbi:YkvA family protein [Methanococcoides burtonii]|uniref:Uncharacterized protein n=1 Tax=Methanococcoides burtonii (strain DSM 6242 / NBRC 107633 / OCM 468 / ACE-M) TaxID=259564 RepID=Q12VT4_METBU|nr:DUF1232 domain-containing protein [Methanococcoides burtonii]ABE52442.1 Hypothetical protein Mbur_1536 [Methanococcoides burtonii DSM 6242]